MACTNCGHENRAEARFCGNCGAALATTAELLSPSVEAAPAATTAQISVVSAAVGLFLLGLTVGMLALMTLGTLALLPGPWRDPLRVVYVWLGAGVGVAVALWLSVRFQWTGRLPSAFGMALVFIGLGFPMVLGLIATVATGFGFAGISGFGFGNTIVFGIVGVGIGLLFPVTFWRHIRNLKRGGKATLVVAGIAGLIGGGLGSMWAAALAPLVALFIGLPAVLIAPIVRTSTQR